MLRVLGLPTALILLLAIFTVLVAAGLELPECTKKCVDDALQTHGCSSIDDTPCLCSEPITISTLKDCVKSICSKEDVSEALQELNGLCPATTTSSSSSSTSSQTPSITFHSTSSQTIAGTASQGVPSPSTGSSTGGDASSVSSTSASPSVSVVTETLISTLLPQSSSTAPSLATAFHTSVVVMPEPSTTGGSAILKIPSYFVMLVSLVVAGLWAA